MIKLIAIAVLIWGITLCTIPWLVVTGTRGESGSDIIITALGTAALISSYAMWRKA